MNNDLNLIMKLFEGDQKAKEEFLSDIRSEKYGEIIDGGKATPVTWELCMDNPLAKAKEL